MLGFLPVRPRACQIRARPKGPDDAQRTNRPRHRTRRNPARPHPHHGPQPPPPDRVRHGEGVVVVAQSDEVEQGIQVVTRSKVLTALNPANARGLSDALVWAASIAEPRQLNPNY